jgi:hypothetical protein
MHSCKRGVDCVGLRNDDVVLYEMILGQASGIPTSDDWMGCMRIDRQDDDDRK